MTNKSKDTVSVIIPTYNAETTIEAALNSIKKQSAVSRIKEIIVINDGSSDTTGQKVKDYMEKHSELPIQFVCQENKGASAARNVGLKIASGELIALLDADDIWLEKKLEKQLQILDENPNIVFLGTGCKDKVFKRKGKKITKLYRADLFDIFWSFFPVTPSVMFRRYAIERVGYFDENQKYCEDINYYLRFCIYYNYYYLPEKLVLIDYKKEYFGQYGLTSNLKGMHEGEMKNLRELFQNKQVSFIFYIFFDIFLNLKYLRRLSKFLLIKKSKNVYRKKDTQNSSIF